VKGERGVLESDKAQPEEVAKKEQREGEERREGD
jgi:hypothetical protein